MLYEFHWKILEITMDQLKFSEFQLKYEMWKMIL